MRRLLLLPLFALWVVGHSLPGVRAAAPSDDAPVAIIAQAPLPPTKLPAVDATALSLETFEGIALANNPTLAQAASRVQAAQGRWVQEGLYPNPTVGYKGDEMGDAGTAGMQGAFVRQEFVTGQKRRLSQSVAGHEVSRLQHACQAQRLRVLTDVRVAFIDLLAAQQAVELNRELTRLGGETAQTAERLFQANEVSRIDQLQAEIEAASAQVRLTDAENRYASAWRRLAAVIGQPDMAMAAVAGRLDEPPPVIEWETALSQLLGCSPELAEAQAGVQAARCALARQQAERMPNVELQTDVMHHNATQENLASVEVAIPLPVFNRNQGNICRALGELRAAEQDVRRVELSLRSRLATVFQRYTSASNQSRQYLTAILPRARTSLGLVQTGYRQGELNYLTVLTAQRTYFQAHLAYLEGLRDLHAAAAEMNGLLLTGGLETSDSRL